MSQKSDPVVHTVDNTLTSKRSGFTLLLSTLLTISFLLFTLLAARRSLLVTILQIPSHLLLPFYRFKQRLKITLAETFRSFSLYDLKK